MAFSCSGAPSASTCAADGASVTLDGTNSATTTITVTTMARSNAPPAQRSYPVPPRGVVFVLLGIALLGSLTAASLRRTRLRVAERPGFFATILLAGILLFASLWTACGGGGGGGTGGGPSGTPAGTYTLTATATYTSGSTTLKHSVALTLIVN